MQTYSPSAAVATLSNREREVLMLVAEDLTDREIGRVLGITERTVRAHVSRIIGKLGVASRVGAAVIATRSKMLEDFLESLDGQRRLSRTP
jgi:DNA-binding CsgD family transcriptional regulator